MEENTSHSEKLQEVEERRARIMQGGGEAAVQKLVRSRGKLAPWERLKLLFDPGTFHELGLWAKPLKTGFDIDNAEVPRDALIAGCGEINGRVVYATCYDPTVYGGSQAAMQFEKLGRAMQQATNDGVPYIGIIDSGGRRIQDLLGKWSFRGPIRVNGCEEGSLDMFCPPMASGVNPQISLVLGPSVAGTAYSPVMSDFIFFRKGTSHMALASPPLLKSATFVDITWEDIGGAVLHATTTGTCDVLVDSDEEALQKCRELLGFLPSNWTEKPPFVATGDASNPKEESFIGIVPDDPSQPYDIHNIITLLVDNGNFFEVQALYATSMVVGFARLAGQAIGVVANDPMVNAGAIDANACDKEARFIRTCNAFNIPLVFLVDTPGFLPSIEQEQSREGLARHAAKPIYAICESSVPKITVYVRRCYGDGRLIMGTREMGIDAAFAWPTAEIRPMDLESLAKRVYQEEIAKAKNPTEVVRSKVRQLSEKFEEPYLSGSVLTIDDIVDPRETRAILVKTLKRLSKKLEPTRPWRKYGLPPL
ncbi:acyl-CoA carboxylase subunit beta [Chloroflexota bacterium]